MRPKILLIVAVVVFVSGCDSGGNDAQRDIARDHLELRICGLPRPSDREYARLLQEQLGVKFNPVAGSMVSEQVLRGSDAYNRAMTAEIERRFGTGILELLETEAQRKSPTSRPAVF